jgi:uncharacterized phiE125 gp8 family phage protein
MEQLRYKLKTAPSFSPASVDELKRQLRIEHTDQDTLLGEILERAVDASQNATGRQYARATYLGYLDNYPVDNEIEIEKGPVDEIVAVKYLAQDAADYTPVSAANYQLDNTELSARLRFLEEFTPDADRMNVVEIEFTCGYQGAQSVPKELTEAILLRAAESYLHPENANENFGMGLRTTAAITKEKNFKVSRY